MKVEVSDGRLIISLKLRKPAPSRSGKTLLIATTRGVRYSNVKIGRKRVRVTANAFINLNKPKART